MVGGVGFNWGMWALLSISSSSDSSYICFYSIYLLMLTFLCIEKSTDGRLRRVCFVEMPFGS